MAVLKTYWALCKMFTGLNRCILTFEKLYLLHIIHNTNDGIRSKEHTVMVLRLFVASRFM